LENTKINLRKSPESFDEYKVAFEKVKNHLQNGNSYLVNLTFKTRISINYSLDEIFLLSNAKYKLLTSGFVVFSPEIFVQIRNNRIYSFPMKGTINADIPGAGEIIMNDFKESAEHSTIVDLIRNDLSLVAEKVHVDRYRYIDIVNTHDKKILQVSSQISGELKKEFQKNIGDLLYSLLPAGSVTGAPKKKTVEIIREVEDYDRGFYTGIFGYFDGENLDSGVMIRYIEKEGSDLYYKSGGGITVNSSPESEYQEMIDKIYVPVY